MKKIICQLLTDKGYKECFCEIDGGHMKVVVKLKDATSKMLIKSSSIFIINIMDISLKLNL